MKSGSDKPPVEVCTNMMSEAESVKEACQRNCFESNPLLTVGPLGHLAVENSSVFLLDVLF